MKVRSRFVSNSSSSSFVCDLCGCDYSGWNASPSDFYHIRCSNGHIICNDSVLGEEELDDEGFDVRYNEDGYEVRAEFCLICQMIHICDDDVVAYLKKKYNVSTEELSKEIKEKFSSYKEFKEFLR